MKAKLKKNWLILLMVFLVALVAIYEIVSIISDQVNWEYAENITCTDSATFSALLIRDEQTLTSTGTGERYYCYGNGEKVAKGSVIARYYSSGDAIRIQNQIQSLRSDIETLRRLDAQNKYYTANLGTTSEQIKNNIYLLEDAVEKNDFNAVYSLQSELTQLYNQRSLILGDRDDFSDVIRSYSEQLETLEASDSAQLSQDTAPCAGYFVNYTDGLEDKLDYEDVSELTEMPSAEKEGAVSGAIGKIVKSSKSYIVIETDADTAAKLSGKSTVKVKLPTFADELRVTVETVNKSTNGRIIVLSTMSENALLMSARTLDIKLIFDEYSGLKVDTLALRTSLNENGEQETGVYIQVGKYIKYKKVTVLYYGKGFAVIKPGENLKIKDEVVIGGNGIDERVRT